MNQDNNTAEKMVNLRSLVIRVLLRWKIIFLTAFLCSALLISYRALKNVQNNQAIERNDYYDSVIAFFDKALDDRYNYMASTVVGNMNPYGQIITQTTYFIKDPQSILLVNSDTSSQVNIEDYNTKMFLNALQQHIYYGIDWNGIKKDLGIDADVLLNELVTCEIDYNSINIFVCYSNNDDCQKIASYINKSIEKQFENLVQKTDLNGYNLIQVNSGTTNVIFGDNFNWLTNRMNEIKSIQTERDNFTKANISKGISPSSSITSSDVKGLIKYGAIGVILGLMVSFVCIGFHLLVKDTVLSGRELNDYLGTNSILTLNKDNNGKQLDLISKRILSIEPENKNTLSNAQKIKLSNDYVNQIVDRKRKIGVLSDIPSAELDKIISLLHEDSNCPNYIPIYDVMNNLEDRKKLKKVDSVVLLVKDELTKYNNINEIVSILEGYNKKIIGTINC